MKLWPEYYNNKLKRMNMKVDEENGKAAGMVNGQYQNVCKFSINGFWKNVSCLVSVPDFILGG